VVDSRGVTPIQGSLSSLPSPAQSNMSGESLVIPTLSNQILQMMGVAVAEELVEREDAAD
jgi:hypothetical protein